MSRLEKILMVLDIIVTVIYIVLLVAERLPSSIGSQITIPPELSWGLLITLISFVAITVLLRLKQRRFIERIEKVHAFVFFPVGTPEENKNLDYHAKHFHKKLIVNFKTKPPQAYYLVAADTSYGWKLIHKYPDMWTSMEDSLYPNPDIHKWCEEKSYKLNPWNASKEELLKADKMDKSFIAEEPDMKQTKHKNARKAKTPVEESKLMKVYSPIHAMIVRVNREIPRESALQLTVGMPVKASLIDFNGISAVFNQHNDKLRKRDLDMWLEIEKEIKARNLFWLNKERQTWFDELEAEYDHLIKHQQR